ncbi:hypothetical protein ON010_g17621 [Phytophthora cinnamomi]|nr:hypothetical protein ON010_g17621 [Phytophthora cinnamomi]
MKASLRGCNAGLATHLVGVAVGPRRADDVPALFRVVLRQCEADAARAARDEDCLLGGGHGAAGGGGGGGGWWVARVLGVKLFGK